MTNYENKYFKYIPIIIGLIALLRGLFGYTLPDNFINDFLDKHFWITYLLIGFGGIMLGKVLFGKSSIGKEVLKYYDLENPKDKINFRKKLVESYKNAEQEIYLTGRGYTHEIGNNSRVGYKLLVGATEEVLKKGIKFYRIHINNQVADEWAETYSSFAEKYEANFKLHADFEHLDLVNVAIIDPNGKNPIVQLLFEMEETSLKKDSYSSSVALFIYNKPRLARSIHKQFIARLERSEHLSPTEIRELGLNNYYFAYGSNMSNEQMINRCPSAKKIGVGILYEYELNFNVYAPHYDKNVAGISKKSGKLVKGIIYALSRNDISELTKIETPGYYPKKVNVKRLNSQEEISSTVFVPQNTSNNQKKISKDYLENLIKGANENGLNELKKELEKLKENAA